MTSFHSWDTVKEEIFDVEDLDVINAGTRRVEVPATPPCSSYFTDGSAGQGELDRGSVLGRTENIEVLRQALPKALPWSTFLPAEDVDKLLTELVDTARGAVALDNLAPIALLLTQWRHSAEIYADPALLAILTREPEGDLGPVSVPPGKE